MIFSIGAALLAAAVVVAVTWPLHRGRAADAEAETVAADVNVYRDQLDEIESDLARGVLTEADAASARVEVSRRLLNASKPHALDTDADVAKAADAPNRSAGTPGWAFAAAAIIPATALGVYLWLGSPTAPDQPRSARLSVPLDRLSPQELIARVEARLQAQPDDGRGWDLIAPLYLRQARFGDAVTAFRNGIRLNGASPERAKGLADSIVGANRGRVTDQALALYEAVAKDDPNRFDAAFWIAIAKEQRGDLKGAAADYALLLPRTQQGTRGRAAVEERLAFVRSAIGTGKPDAKTADPNAKAAPPKTATGPTEDDVKAAEGMAPEDRSAMIRGMVARLDERLGDASTDLDGWQRLVRAYMVLGERDQARAALQRAEKALRGNAQALAALKRSAEALGLTSS
ncbi:MAG: c-type cytochrome biogenesis protein CcmI [Pseudomonadota bacterium]